ncbi:MAG: hypothetical protein HQL71_00085, partial [Magnetococcales bacterium]|nr:hypothetical protein [Magnetococcales bacterium]
MEDLKQQLFALFMVIAIGLIAVDIFMPGSDMTTSKVSKVEQKPIVKTASVVVEPKLADNDIDGVEDQYDKCPSTEANTEVNWQGCPLDHDTDKDGI